jgi:hypothetical protein
MAQILGTPAVPMARAWPEAAGARDNRKKARKPARVGKPVRLTTGRMSTVHILLAFSRRVRGTRQLSSIPSRGTVVSQCDRRLDPGRLNATPCLGPIQAMTYKDGRKGPGHAGIEAYAIIQVPTRQIAFDHGEGVQLAAGEVGLTHLHPQVCRRRPELAFRFCQTRR